MSLVKYSCLEESLTAIVFMQNKEICGRLKKIKLHYLKIYLNKESANFVHPDKVLRKFNKISNFNYLVFHIVVVPCKEK